MARKTQTTRPLSASLDYFDTLSLFKVQESLGEVAPGGDSSSPRMQYQPLMRRCEAIRTDLRMTKADATFATMAIDQRSEKQSRFVEALRGFGILTDPIDYRSATVRQILQTSDDRSDRISSLAPQVAYLLGLAAGRSEGLNAASGNSDAVRPEALIVTGVFDVFHPLMDFTTNRNGRAALAFFRSFLDERWAKEGLFEPDFPIKFSDLEPHSEELLGVDLAASRRQLRSRSGGLGGF